MKKIIAVVCIIVTVVAIVGIRYADRNIDGVLIGDGTGHYTRERVLTFYGHTVWTDANYIEFENMSLAGFLHLFS